MHQPTTEGNVIPHIIMDILFVENHRTFVEIVTNKFLSEYKVTVTPSIKEALDEFNRKTYEIVLSDYDLDDGKGDELIKEIRSINDNVKIIAVSSHEKGNNALLKAGADSICSKMNFSKINSVIKEVLS